MKILNASQIKEWDNFTIEHMPISSIELMNVAVGKCLHWITDKFSPDFKFIIICGKGNNGGDGLGIARELLALNYKVDVYVVNDFKNNSDDFNAQLKTIKNYIEVNSIKDLEIKGDEVLIDAILGSGLTRNTSGLIKDIISYLNKLDCFVVSIDVPSGFYAFDNTENEEVGIVKANITLTFQQLKFSFLFANATPYIGDVYVLDIGLLPEFLNLVNSNFYFITALAIKKLWKPLPKFSHKGSTGKVLMIAGSENMLGAAVLASKATLNAGAGLVVLHSIKQIKHSITIAVPEVITSLVNANVVSELPELVNYKSIAVGPGLTVTEETSQMLKKLIQYSPIPLVIDADALNILSENKTWLDFLPKRSVLTPHPKEFERLIGEPLEMHEGVINQLKKFSIKYGVTVVLKGAFTKICLPSGEVYVNTSGNPGMASAGMGDVLTGIITGLIAQGYAPEIAAILAVYWHGFSADNLLKLTAMESITASKVIDHLGHSLKILQT